MNRWIRIVPLIGALHLLFVTAAPAQTATPSYAEAGTLLVQSLLPAEGDSSQMPARRDGTAERIGQTDSGTHL